LAKARAKAKTLSQSAKQAAIWYNFTGENKLDIMAKVRGLMAMLVGTALVGYAMGGLSKQVAVLFIGLAVLLAGFTLFVD
jgi:hypothetical protein